MKTKRIICKILILICFSLVLKAKAQEKDTTKIIPAVNLNGPRIGITYVTPGKLADELYDQYNVTPYYTQFGWQFETRFFTLPSGVAGLVEGVVLVAGMEQGAFLPNGSCLIGMRNAKGLEFGVGPNISLAGVAFVIAVGVTFKSSYINFPVNFAIVPSSEGIRLSILTGFNARRK